MGKKLDITGETYGYAKAIRNTGKQYHGSYIWEFECTLCGKRFEAKIRDVRYGSVKSCGCWHRKNLDKMDTDEKFGQIEGTNVSKILSKKIPQNNTSGHKGVSLAKRKGRKDTYVAYIYFQGIRYHLGSFKNIDAAVNAREEAENKLYADFLEWYAEEYPERWKRLKKRD